MALGVLNNLSAIYAENSLNNTNASLQTVLQQLSSGSRINSGADDAAGLSLVNGLEANQTALMQSETNATEGVGFLQVADGALSQVTNLLDRAVTLATEASNGTLNSSQDSAANQEYQSILAEITNIGSTTTYNQDQVFAGNDVAIYTGDSSAAGSSLDDLFIRELSESSLGDTGGAMSYTSGQDNAFINLSTGTTNASATDSLSGSSSSITVNYLTDGAGGTAVNATATITVGAGTSYSNTAQGMIEAVNNAGLGLSASFTTAQAAGTAAVSSALGSGSQTGILITGQGVGAGTNDGRVGTLTVSGAGSADTDTLGGSLTIGTSTITLGTANSTDTLANLATTINGGDYGVIASVTGSVLTMTSTDPTLSISSTGLTDSTDVDGVLTLANVPTALADMGTTPGVLGTMTMSGGLATNVLAGTMNITGANGLVDSINLTAGGYDLATLAQHINGQDIGVTATVVGTALTLSSTSADSQASFNAADIAGVTDSTTPAATFAISDVFVPPASYYSMGVSGTVTDTSDGGGGTALTTMTTDTDGTTGTATTSYSDSAGANLSGTDLLDQADAQVALIDVNTAISDVAAQDGYIGAQINTLNSISQVMSTQQENVVSAQNAIQATDYASATSNMSKYEILSQTGIAALAQANSVQQEVTKLLQ
ncbi:MAG: flagellin [Terracidiphilus sp.]